MISRFADQSCMRRALQLASKGAGKVAPNPMVGCLIVKDRKIIAEGYHKKFGGPHAEVHALKKIKFRASGATLYVTLEPCYHWGKTPPCVDAVIRSGVKRVVIAMRDVNPLTAGKSIRKLRNAGIRVDCGILRQEAIKLNRFFIKHITQGMPYVIVKIAQSADGKIAAKPGNRTAITGKSSQQYVHQLRSTVDAVLVGRETIRIDNPLLNVRHGSRHKIFSQPKRVILDSHLKCALSSQLFKSKGGEIILIASTSASKQKERIFIQAGCQVIRVRNARHGLDIKAILRELAKRGITSVLVEGGSRIFTSFYESGLVDEWQLITSPQIIGVKGVPAFIHKKIRLDTSTGKINRLGRDSLFILKSS